MACCLCLFRAVVPPLTYILTKWTWPLRLTCTRLKSDNLEAGESAFWWEGKAGDVKVLFLFSGAGNSYWITESTSFPPETLSLCCQMKKYIGKWHSTELSWILYHHSHMAGRRDLVLLGDAGEEDEECVVWNHGGAGLWPHWAYFIVLVSGPVGGRRAALSMPQLDRPLKARPGPYVPYEFWRPGPIDGMMFSISNSTCQRMRWGGGISQLCF